MATFISALGIFAILAALSDVFQTLFHPSGRGALSDWTARAVWRFFRSLSDAYPPLLTFAGPVAILSIILSWVGLVWLGFALLYFPHLQTGFTYDQSISPADRQGMFDAINLSAGALITLSDGMSAKFQFLQLLRAIEAMLGFGLLTASVSWLLSIYPVLELRRSIAQRATLLHHAEVQNGVDIIRDTPEQAQDWLFSLGCDLSSLRNQMAQFPITFYFFIGEARTSLPGALPYLWQLAERANNDSTPAVRLSATILGGAVKSFLDETADYFLRIPSDDPKEVMRALAAENRATPMRLDNNEPQSQKKKH